MKSRTSAQRQGPKAKGSDHKSLQDAVTMAFPGKESNNDVEILVVEDSPTQAEYLKNLLERRGFRVFIASNGKEGLASIRAHKPTIVISDIMMPEMDGFEMCHQIKIDEGLKDIPVILLTSLSDPADIIRGLLCAADNFIVKPPDEKYLFSRIDYILVNRKLREQTHTQLGVEIYFGGQRHSINSDRLQILDLLFSTYETAVDKNLELAKAHDDLKTLNEELEQRVEVRTAELSEEIEERKRVEEKLRKLSRAVEQSPASVIITDTNGTIEYVNPKFEEITGYSLHEVIGKTPRILKSGEMSSEGYKKFWDTIVRGEEWRGEFHNKKKNGELFWESASISPIVDEKGAIRHFIAVKEDITARKKAEEEIHLQASLLNQVSNAIIATDLDGAIFYWNKAAEKLYGWKSEEVLGRKGNDIVVPKSLQPQVQRIRTHVDTFEVWEGEMEFQRKNGTTIPVSVSSALLRDARGTPIGRIGVSSDITERKRNEEQIKTLAHAIRSVSECVSVTDLDNNILFVNEAFAKTYGYSEDELLGKNITMLRSPRERSQVTKEILDETATAGWQGELLNRRKNGEEFPIYLSTSVIRDENGRTIALIGVATDITERKQSREALHRSEEQYRSLVDGARDAIFSLSTDAVIKSLNPAFGVITGWKREEWLGKSFTDLLHPEDRSKAYEIFQALAQGKKSAPQEYRVVTKTGEYFTGEFTTTAQVVAGKLMGILGIGRDVTERKVLENQLRQAQKLESIGTLAGGIAHDFNNILGIIVAYGSLLQRGKTSADELREYTDTMLKAAERGAALVKQILTFARKSDVSVESVQVNYVIKELLSMLHQMFPKTIGFSVDLNKSLPLISIDPGQLNQALMNLCVNARDAILDADRVGNMQSTLSIKTETVSGESLRHRFSSASSDGYVAISVADTGTGMDEQTRQRIFEPFFTTKEQGKGTGLGLAVVHGIVQSHKGFIDLKSEVGKGTMFTLYFPVLKDASASAVVAKEEIKDMLGGSETVLVVEDENALKMLLKNLLEAKGYSVITASDGLEAMTVFQQHKDTIAIVVSDHGLPGMNGADVTRNLIQMKKGLKCILASGYIEPNKKSEIFKSGVRDFVQKPYNPMDVLRKIREVLDMK